MFTILTPDNPKNYVALLLFRRYTISMNELTYNSNVNRKPFWSFLMLAHSIETLMACDFIKGEK